jgi:putative ABC transport system permease protein
MARLRIGLLVSLLAFAAAAPRTAAAENAPHELLLSRQLIQAKGLAVGDVVQVSAHADGHEAQAFRVAASYEPMPDPFRLTARRYEARLHLPDLLALTGSESIDQINVALDRPEDLPAFARGLRAAVPGLGAEGLGHDDPHSPFVALRRFHTAIAWVTVLASTAFLLALMVIRADERREIAGILRLLGFSRGRVLALVLVEGVCVALAGSCAGMLLALAAQAAFNRFFQWHYDTTLVFVRIGPSILLRCIALAVPLGVGAGLVASFRLLRGEIMALLRR